MYDPYMYSIKCVNLMINFRKFISKVYCQKHIMFNNMLSVVIVFVVFSGVQGITHEDCPGNGHSDHGSWVVNNTKEEPRCVLKCKVGYEPDKCHVLRKIRHGTWNREIPYCVKKSWMPWKTLAKAGVAVAAGAGAAAAAPVVIAAGLQGAAVSSGSVFAALQSAGAAGLTAGTKAGVFSAFTAFTGAASTFFGGEACEAE